MRRWPTMPTAGRPSWRSKNEWTVKTNADLNGTRRKNRHVRVSLREHEGMDEVGSLVWWHATWYAAWYEGRGGGGSRAQRWGCVRSYALASLSPASWDVLSSPIHASFTLAKAPRALNSGGEAPVLFGNLGRGYLVLAESAPKVAIRWRGNVRRSDRRKARSRSGGMGACDLISSASSSPLLS